jgi:DNA (cytosine-5)-methyltransferase 1
MCTDISVAGKMDGLREDTRSGITWREIVRAIRELRPRYVLVENVAALLSDDNGRSFGRVLGTLASLGYNAEWDVLSACAFGAPHTRERVFVVAYADCHRLEGMLHTSNSSSKGGGVFTGSKASRASCTCGRNEWKTEPGVGRVVDGFPERVDQIRGLGNAVVPVVAEYVGRLIVDHYMRRNPQ